MGRKKVASNGASEKTVDIHDMMQATELDPKQEADGLLRALADVTRKAEEKEKVIAKLTATEENERGELKKFQKQLTQQEGELHAIRKALWVQVRTTPSWPRSWANFSLLSLYPHRNAWANLDILGQSNTFLAAAQNHEG
jgi:hypothetical protein